MSKIIIKNGTAIDVSDYKEGQALPIQTLSRKDLTDTIENVSITLSSFIKKILIFLIIFMLTVMTIIFVSMIHQGDIEWSDTLIPYGGIFLFFGFIFLIQYLEKKRDMKLASSVSNGKFRLLLGTVKSKSTDTYNDDGHVRKYYYINTETANNVRCLSAVWNSLVEGDKVYILQIEMQNGKYRNSDVYPVKSTKIMPDLEEFIIEERL